MPITAEPFPSVTKVSKDEIKLAEEANILLIGSDLASSIVPIIENIAEKYSSKFKTPLKVYNWARTGEGVHRTYQKIKSLKTLPTLAIYLGGNSEFREKYFSPNDQAKIKRNYELSENPYISALLEFFPIFSRFIFSPTQISRFKSGKLKTYEKNFFTQFTESQVLKYLETNYFLYEKALMSINRKFRNNGKKIINITYPYYPEQEVALICPQSRSPAIDYLIKDIEAELDKADDETILKYLQDLSEVSLGNAKTYWLRAKLEKKTKKFKSALNHFALSKLFDCSPKGANKITNTIIRRISNSMANPVVDWSEIIFLDYGKDYLFMDEVVPQEKYFQTLRKELDKNITKILRI